MPVDLLASKSLRAVTMIRQRGLRVLVHRMALRLMLGVVLFMSDSTVRGVESIWINPNGGLFNTQTNWDGFVPLSNATALFDLPNNYPVVMTTSRTNDRLTVNRGSVQLMLGGVNYTLGNGLYVGDVAGQHGLLSMTNGAVTSGSINVGLDAGEQGTLTLGANLRANLSGMTRIGASGWGDFTLRDGGTLTDQGAALGQSSTGYGTALVTGWQTHWETVGLTVGNAGTGSLTVADRANLESQSAVLALNNSSSGTMVIDGAGTRWLNGGGISIGAAGAGTLSIQNGAVVDSGSALLGTSAGARGIVSLSGKDSIWSIAGDIEVGRAGSAELLIQDGASLQSSSGQLASETGSTATVTLSGASSTWSVQEKLIVGGSGLVRGGTADVRIEKGATLDVGGGTSLGEEKALHIWDGSRMVIDGGMVHAQSIRKDGMLELQDGLLEIVGGAASDNILSKIDGQRNAARPMLRVADGGRANWTGSLTVGDQYQGELSALTGSSIAIAGDLLIGAQGTAAGRVEASSGAAISVGGDVAIGGTATSAAGSGLVSLGQGATISAISGSVILWPEGTIELHGGKLYTKRLQLAGGTVDFTEGTLALVDPTTLDAAWMNAILGVTHVLRDRQNLELGVATVSSPLEIQGGAMSTTGLNLHAPLQLQSGSLAVSANTTIAPSGALHVHGNSVANLGGSVNNYGTIALQSELATLQGTETLINQGTVRGSGRLEISVDNQPGGVVQVDPSDRMVLLGVVSSNDGEIIARGGTIEFPHGLSNRGTIALTGDAPQLRGALVNAAMGSILVGGNSNAFLHGDIDSDGRIEVYSGSSATVLGTLRGTGAVVVQPGARLDLFPSAATETVSGDAGFLSRAAVQSAAAVPEALSLENEGIVRLSSSDHKLASVRGNGVLRLLPNSQLLAGQIEQHEVLIENAATLSLEGGNGTGATSRIDRLAIAGDITPTGTLDLGTGALVLQPDPDSKQATLQTTKNQIRSAQKRTAGRAIWDGPGIMTSVAPAMNESLGGEVFGLAAVRNDDFAALRLPMPQMFLGQEVDAGSILVRYTLVGDANLDGVIDFDDYGLIDGTFSGALPNVGWLSGDFNYDGVIDFDDYGLIDFAYSRQADGRLTTPWTSAARPSGARQLGAQLIPEPGTCGLFLLALALIGVARSCRIRELRPQG